jgi:hypothetical protein
MIPLKNLVYVLLALMMLFFGLRYMTLSGNQIQSVFAMSWLCLALFVIGGNFTQFLYRPKKQVQAKRVQSYKRNGQRKRQRQTMR